MACSSRREQELTGQGWRRQFLADEPRLSEAVDEYRSLGFEVHLEAFDIAACQDSDACTSCFAQPEVAGRFKIIFTRPKQAAGSENLLSRSPDR